MAEQPTIPQVIQIRSQPGIKRDGTQLEGDAYVDGQWVRFQRGLPRKIGGYRSINKYLEGLPRAVHEYTQDLLTYLHLGSAAKVERLYIDGSLNTSVVTDRTPTSGLTASDNNMWQFTAAYDTSAGNQLVAQVAPNLECICNSTGGEVFTGDLLGTGVLVAVPALNKPANFNATGGVVALPPYTFVYGNDGYVAWSVPNGPADYVSSGAGNAYITAQKIVKAMPLRGGPGNSPSGLFWSADSLVRGSYVGGTAVFQFDTISTQSSIMSPNSVIEYDGIFFWIGTDRFLTFNGVVREVENNLNMNFFFDNINMQYRQKVFAIKVPRFGEIWWCFPKGDSTEPNHAIIYNVRENTWYDTALAEDGRGAGAFPAVFRRPIMTGVEPRNAVCTDVAINAAGTGYTAGDVLTVDGGIFTIPVEITVDTVGGGGDITAASISNAGSYTTEPTDPVSITGGTGSSATFNLTFVNPYSLWVHEIGNDAVDGQSVQPIPSYFETADITLPVLSGTNRSLQVLMVEPDFVQTGDMLVQTSGRANARAAQVYGPEMTFADTATTPQEQVVYMKTQARQLRFKFTSNTVGGDYQMGTILAHVREGDGTTIG